MSNIPVKIKVGENGKLPTYATEGSSGMDIYAAERTAVWALDSFKVKTDLYVEIPEGYEIQIRPRSGLAAKEGITVLNTPGTIDSSYRGEIQVILYNTSQHDYIVEKGDRIAQMVLQEVPKIKWEVVEEIDNNTERGAGGFGSTGTS